MNVQNMMKWYGYGISITCVLFVLFSIGKILLAFFNKKNHELGNRRWKLSELENRRWGLPENYINLCDSNGRILAYEDKISMMGKIANWVSRGAEVEFDDKRNCVKILKWPIDGRNSIHKEERKSYHFQKHYETNKNLLNV